MSDDLNDLSNIKGLDEITSAINQTISTIKLKKHNKQFARKVFIEKIKLNRSPFPKFAQNYNMFTSNLEEYLDNLETRLENELIELLAPLEIHASIKTNKKSLPYQKEIIFRKRSESYVNGMFEYQRMFRMIAKELLENDCRKIRFYVFIEPYGEDVSGFEAFIGGQGIEYRFRYYQHKTVE